MKTFNQWHIFIRNRVISLKKLSPHKAVPIENCERVLPFIHYDQQKTKTNNQSGYFEWKKKCDITDRYLRETNDRNIKYCTQCYKLVYDVKNEQELSYHVNKGHCVTMLSKPVNNPYWESIGYRRYMDVRGEVKYRGAMYYTPPPSNALTYHPNFKNDFINDVRFDTRKHLIIQYQYHQDEVEEKTMNNSEIKKDINIVDKIRSIHEAFQPLLGGIMIDEGLKEIVKYKKCKDNEQKVRISNTLQLLKSEELDTLPAFPMQTRQSLIKQLETQLNKLNQER